MKENLVEGRSVVAFQQAEANGPQSLSALILRLKMILTFKLVNVPNPECEFKKSLSASVIGFAGFYLAAEHVIGPEGISQDKWNNE